MYLSKKETKDVLNKVKVYICKNRRDENIDKIILLSTKLAKHWIEIRNALDFEKPVPSLELNLFELSFLEEIPELGYLFNLEDKSEKKFKVKTTYFNINENEKFSHCIEEEDKITYYSRWNSWYNRVVKKSNKFERVEDLKSLSFSQLMEYKDQLMDNVKNYWSYDQYDEIEKLLLNHFRNTCQSLKRTFEPFQKVGALS